MERSQQSRHQKTSNGSSVLRPKSRAAPECTRSLYTHSSIRTGTLISPSAMLCAMRITGRKCMLIGSVLRAFAVVGVTYTTVPHISFGVLPPYSLQRQSLFEPSSFHISELLCRSVPFCARRRRCAAFVLERGRPVLLYRFSSYAVIVPVPPFSFFLFSLSF